MTGTQKPPLEERHAAAVARRDFKAAKFFRLNMRRNCRRHGWPIPDWARVRVRKPVAAE